MCPLTKSITGQKKGSVQRTRTQPPRPSDSIYPKPQQKWVTGFHTLCCPHFPHSQEPACLEQPAKSLALFLADCVQPCFSFSIHKLVECLFPKTEQDRACVDRWFRDHFPQEQGFLPSSTPTLKLWLFFFHCFPVSVFNRTDYHLIHRTSLLLVGEISGY